MRPAHARTAVLVLVAATLIAALPQVPFANAAPEPTLTVFSDDFEAPTGHVWTAQQDTSDPEGSLTTWQLVNNTNSQLTWSGPGSGDQFWYVGLLGSDVSGVSGLEYTDNADTSLVSAPIALPATSTYTKASLTYFLAGSSEDGFDFLNVSIKDASASTWTEVAGHDGDALGPFFNDGSWAPASADVTPFMGHTVQLRFRFSSDAFSTDPSHMVGWNVDLVNVTYTDPVLVTDPTAPLPPTGFGATAASGASVTLAWGAPASDGGSPITGYKLSRGAASGAESLLADVGLATSYVDAAVTPGSAYYYTVTAVNAIGESAPSVEIVVLAADPTLPGAPAGLVALGGTNEIGLAWSAPADTGNLAITSYQIYRDGSAYATSTGTSFRDDAPGALARTYAVAAVNAVGEGPQSASATATAVQGPTFKAYVDPLGDDRTEGVGPLHFLITSAGEPSVGVDQVTGDALIQVDRLTLKLHPDGANGVWTDVSSPFQASLPLSDPIGWLDPATNRYFGGTIMGGCSQIQYTDDGGATWIPTTGACDQMPGHDHETIGGGAYPSGLAPLAQHPTIVWYCAHDNVAARCAPSVDGGLTYLPAEPIYQSFLVGDTIATCIGLHGHVRVAPNGTAVVPASSCGQGLDTPGAAITFDGLTWTGFVVPGMTNGHFDPSAAFSADGSLYYANCNADGTPRVAVSGDGGNHFGAATDVSGGVIKNCEFPTIIAGDGDRAAFAFLGTTTPGDDQDGGFTGIWHLYVAYTLDHGASWILVDATGSDPVQAGCIDAGGTVGQVSGAGCNNRNLLDFMDIALDPRGYVVVGYADGCVASCITSPSHASSTAAYAAIAYQTGGACLYAAKCALPAPNGQHEPSLVPGVGLPSELTSADVCDPNIVVFSRVPNQPVAFDYHAEACAVEGLTGIAPADTRVLLPQSSSVQVRYSVDVPGADHLVAVFSGLGASSAPKTMTRALGTTGGVTYDSPSVAIDPSLTGEITMRVYKPDNTLLGSTTWHTAT